MNNSPLSPLIIAFAFFLIFAIFIALFITFLNVSVLLLRYFMNYNPDPNNSYQQIKLLFNNRYPNPSLI